MTVQEAKEKLIAIARTEVGYREGGNNYTKYSADPMITRLYGWTPQNQPWCCVFVNWCFMTSFGYDLGSKLTYGGTAACSNSASLFQAAGAWSRFPQVGDQAFYYSGGGINHTGLVVAVDGTEFTAIEGNYSDKVSIVKHNTASSSVAGFGRPNWELIEADTTIPASSMEKPKQTQPAEDHAWKPRTLSQSNAYNSDCVVLQALLNAHHFPCGSADGFYGPKTITAVTNAQQYYGIEVDGIAGKETFIKLGIDPAVFEGR